jgi:hypothetical protein
MGDAIGVFQDRSMQIDLETRFGLKSSVQKHIWGSTSRLRLAAW